MNTVEQGSMREDPAARSTFGQALYWLNDKRDTHLGDAIIWISFTCATQLLVGFLGPKNPWGSVLNWLASLAIGAVLWLLQHVQLQMARLQTDIRKHESSTNDCMRELVSHELCVDIDSHTLQRVFLRFGGQSAWTEPLIWNYGVPRLRFLREDMAGYACGQIHVLDSQHALAMWDAIVADPRIRFITVVDLVGDSKVPMREGHLKKTKARFGRIGRFAEKLGEHAAVLASRGGKGIDAITVRRCYIFTESDLVALGPNALWALEENYQRSNHQYYFRHHSSAFPGLVLEHKDLLGHTTFQRCYSVSDDLRSEDDETVPNLGTFVFFHDKAEAGKPGTMGKLPIAAICLPPVCSGEKHNDGVVVLDPTMVKTCYEQVMRGRWDLLSKQDYDTHVLEKLGRYSPKYNVLFKVMPYWNQLSERARQLAEHPREIGADLACGRIVAVDLGMLGNSIDVWKNDSFYQKVTEKAADVSKCLRSLAGATKEANCEQPEWDYRRTYFMKKEHLQEHSLLRVAAGILRDQAKAGVKVGVIVLTEQQVRDWPENLMADFNYVCFPNSDRGLTRALFSLTAIKESSEDSPTWVMVRQSEYSEYCEDEKVDEFFRSHGLDLKTIDSQLWGWETSWLVPPEKLAEDEIAEWLREETVAGWLEAIVHMAGN